MTGYINSIKRYKTKTQFFVKIDIETEFDPNHATVSMTLPSWELLEKMKLNGLKKVCNSYYVHYFNLKNLIKVGLLCYIMLPSSICFTSKLYII